MRYWKVGDIAHRTGISVRMLHHYDEIGLLCPSRRSDAGYRLYSEADVAKLQQVVSLRQLGFSLREIRDSLIGSDFSSLNVIQAHLLRLREQIDLQQRLCVRLEI